MDSMIDEGADRVKRDGYANAKNILESLNQLK